MSEQKSLEELEEEDSSLDVEVSVARKRAMIKAMEKREGKGSWRLFSSNGRLSGLNWTRLRNRLGI